MDIYLYTNLIISIVALATLRLGNGSSHINYYLSLFAICSWFVPYHLLAQLMPEQVLATPIIISMSVATEAATATANNINVFEFNTWLLRILIALTTIGALVFSIRWVQHLIWQRNLLTDAEVTPLSTGVSKVKVPVYLSNQVESGLLIGILKPVILISNKIKQPQLIKLIIAHENQHLTNHDNIRLVLLELAARLFWWNPLVQKLVAENRFYIEAICDEHASQQYGKSNYLNDLSALMLGHHIDPSNALASAALTKGKHNLTRVKRLKEKRKMTIKNKLSYLLATLVTLVTISWSAISTADIGDHKAENDELGALIGLDLEISNRNGDVENVHSSLVTIWVNFNEEASFQFSSGLIFNLKVTEMQDSAFFEMDLIELDQTSKKKVVTAEPKLTLAYGKEGMIEFHNPEISQNFYSIKVTIDKTALRLDHL